jgi:hypothetical protein
MKVQPDLIDMVVAVTLQWAQLSNNCPITVRKETPNLSAFPYLLSTVSGVWMMA